MLVDVVSAYFDNYSLEVGDAISDTTIKFKYLETGQFNVSVWSCENEEDKYISETTLNFDFDIHLFLSLDSICVIKEEIKATLAQYAINTEYFKFTFISTFTYPILITDISDESYLTLNQCSSPMLKDVYYLSVSYDTKDVQVVCINSKDLTIVNRQTALNSTTAVSFNLLKYLDFSDSPVISWDFVREKDLQAFLREVMTNKNLCEPCILVNICEMEWIFEEPIQFKNSTQRRKHIFKALTNENFITTTFFPNDNSIHHNNPAQLFDVIFQPAIHNRLKGIPKNKRDRYNYADKLRSVYKAVFYSKVTAFSMGFHKRLGKESVLSSLSMPEEIIQNIFSYL